VLANTCVMFIYFSKLLSLYLFRFLRPFATFRKAIISFVVSVCPPVYKELDSQWTDFHEIWYLSIFRKSAEKIQVTLKSGKNNGYFT